MKKIKSSEFKTLIPASVMRMAELFSAANYDLYVVGGAVRDFLMDKEINDFDVCTNATPDEVMEILKGEFTFDKVGAAFGVILVKTAEGDFEVATFRKDIYTEEILGETRNPDVKFTTIEEDVQRRDLTINALFYNIQTEEIVDYVGGIEDINNKVIRMVGNPVIRIIEDPLRIMRALRFSARYKFDIETSTIKAISLHAKKIEIIEAERIFDEFQKAFKQSESLMFFKYLLDLKVSSVMKYIFPDTFIEEHDINILDMGTFEHITSFVARLFHNDGADPSKHVQKYKFTNKIMNKVYCLFALSDHKGFIMDAVKRIKQCHITKEELLDYFHINTLQHFFITTVIEFTPSISAQDLMEQGFSGEALGLKIKELEQEKYQEFVIEKIAETNFVQFPM